jgi:hypothetical protein
MPTPDTCRSKRNVSNSTPTPLRFPPIQCCGVEPRMLSMRSTHLEDFEGTAGAWDGFQVNGGRLRFG